MAVRSDDDRQVCLRLLQRLASARRAIIGIYFPPIPWPMTSASKKLLAEENRSLRNSFGTEVRKMEKRNNNNSIKIEQHQRKVVLLKESNADLAAALQAERSKSRMTIEQLLDDAEQVVMEAKGIEQAANAAINLERLNLHKERQYHASQMTQSKSLVQS